MKSLHDVAGTHLVQLNHPAVAAKATRTDPVLYAPFDCKLAGVLFIPMDAITADASDYATITIVNGDGDTIVAASFDGPYDSLDANQPLLLDCDDEELEAGDLINIQTADTGSSGMALPVFLTVAMFLAR